MRPLVDTFVVLSVLAFAQGRLSLTPPRRGFIFGIRAGGAAADIENSQETTDEEFERAEKAILDAVTRVEQKVQALVDTEVETLFPHGREHREGVSESTKKAVAKGAEKIKTQVEGQPYPYAFPLNKKRDKVPHEHKDRNILHAVEAAEKAVLHAIEQEVDSLFCDGEPHGGGSTETDAHDEKAADKDNHRGRHDFFLDKKSVSKAKKSVQGSLKKAQETVEETQEKRREFLSKETEAAFEDYADFTGW